MSFDLKKYYRHIDSSHIDNTKLSVFSKVEYIPLYAIHIYHDKNNSINRELDSDEDFIYPRLKNLADNRISRYADLFQNLNGDRTMRSIAYSFKSNDLDQTVFVSNGIITDEYGNILLLLTVKKEYFTSICEIYNHSDEEIDFSNLVLFVADEFFKNPIYNYLWKKIEKEFYYDAISKGVKIEVDTIDVITKKCFNDGIDVNFDTIDEFHNYLNNDIYTNIVNVYREAAEERQKLEHEIRRQRQERNDILNSLSRDERKFYRQAEYDTYDATYEEILAFVQRIQDLPRFRGFNDFVQTSTRLAVFINGIDNHIDVFADHINMSVEEMIENGLFTMEQLVEPEPAFTFVDENTSE